MKPEVVVLGGISTLEWFSGYLNNCSMCSVWTWKLNSLQYHPPSPVPVHYLRYPIRFGVDYAICFSFHKWAAHTYKRLNCLTDLVCLSAYTHIISHIRTDELPRSVNFSLMLSENWCVSEEVLINETKTNNILFSQIGKQNHKTKPGFQPLQFASEDIVCK